MPTNLGVLPSYQPAPVAFEQHNFGNYNGQVEVSPAWAAGQPLSDGGSSGFQITVTPARPCYWLVELNLLTHYPTGATWTNAIYGIRLYNQTDLDGVTIGTQMYCTGGEPNDWRTYTCSYMYRLGAGITYTAVATYEGGYGFYYIYQYWSHMSGILLSEGIV